MRLFPDGAIDRADPRVASNNSACGGDVAAYLSGARTRFGSHLVDPALRESVFMVQRLSSSQTQKVRVNVAAYRTGVREQMRKIEAGGFEPADIDLFQTPQWDYARRLTSQPLGESYIVEDAADDLWPAPPRKDLGRRRDNDDRDVPETP